MLIAFKNLADISSRTFHDCSYEQKDVVRLHIVCTLFSLIKTNVAHFEMCSFHFASLDFLAQNTLHKPNKSVQLHGKNRSTPTGRVPTNVSSVSPFWKRRCSIAEYFDLRTLLHYLHFIQVTNPFIIYSHLSFRHAEPCSMAGHVSHI